MPALASGVRAHAIIEDSDAGIDGETLIEKYSRRGHPTVDELIAAQGLSFPRNPADLLGNFWPEEESIDDFLTALHAWRGRERTDPAA